MTAKTTSDPSVKALPRASTQSGMPKRNHAAQATRKLPRLPAHWSGTSIQSRSLTSRGRRTNAYKAPEAIRASTTHSSQRGADASTRTSTEPPTIIHPRSTAIAKATQGRLVRKEETPLSVTPSNTTRTPTQINSSWVEAHTSESVRDRHFGGGQGLGPVRMI